MKNRALLALIFAFALAMPITAGSAAGDEPESVLRIGFMQKVDSLNPNVGVVDPSYVFWGFLYDSPFVVDEDLNVIGDLCTNTYIDEDYEPYGSAWIMEFTEHAYWHDGERFNADDVVFNFNLNCGNYTTMWANQPYSYYMKYSEKIDDFTVRVHYFDRETGESMPAAYADSLWMLMLPEHLLRDMSSTDISFNWEGVFEDMNPPIVGTGQFMATEDIYEEFLQGDKLTVVRNPDYFWKEERGKEIQFDKLELHFYNDATAMAIALEIGDLDVAWFPPHDYHTIKTKVENEQLANIATYDGPKCTFYWTMISVNANSAGPNPSRLDPAVRQAMAMATNKQYIVDNYYLGYGDPGTTLIPPINEKWHYEPTEDELYHYDIDVANALLEAAGYRYVDGSDTRVCTADSYAVQEKLVPENFPLKYDFAIRQEAPEERDVAYYIKSEWEKIGIEINIMIMTEPALSTYIYGYMYDIMTWYWSSDVDPNYQLFVQSKKSWNGWSDNMYYNPAYEENYSAQVREFDYDKRKEYVDNCQRVNYLDAYFMLLTYADQTYAWRTDTFDGWGDWEAHPGRSIDNFWSANPLYLDLVPKNVEDDDIPWMAIAAGVGVLSAVAVAVVALRKRGGRKGKEEETSIIGE